MKTRFPFILICILLIINVSCSDNKPIEIKGRIDAKGAGEIKLGKSYSEVLDKIDETVYDVSPNDKNGFDIKENGEILISFWSKSQDNTIGFVKVLSDKYQTEKGLKIGDSIEKVRAIYPELKLSFDEMDGEYYFAPDDLQVYDEDKPEVLCLFYVDSKEKNVDFKLNEKTNRFESSMEIEGNIKNVLIYKWK